MDKYNHTAAEALHYAEIFEMRSKRREAINLHAEAKELDLYATALKFWAQYGQILKVGSSLVAKAGCNDQIYIVAEIEDDGFFIDQYDNRRFFSYYRKATPAEIAAGHRIDKVNSIKCWSCDSVIELEQLSQNDSFCPECNAEIENNEVQDGQS